MYLYKRIIILLICVSPIMAKCQAVIGDTLVNLNEIIVKSWKDNSNIILKEDASIRINTSILDNMPKIMGESNPLRILQSFSGVSTNGEFNSAMHIEGSENCHNLLSINGVNVYGANHLLGFFSVFNSTHFSSFDMQKNAFRASNIRLGASLDFVVDSTFSQDDNLKGDFSISLMSFQGTIKKIFSKKFLAIVSARQSFLNLFYKNILTFDELKARYNFNDYNLSLVYKPKENQKFLYNFYAGTDNLLFGDEIFVADVLFKWGNLISSLDYQIIKNKFTVNNKFYYSRYKTFISVDELKHGGNLKSNIHDFGYNLDFNFKMFDCGIKYSFYDILPQKPIVDGKVSDITNQTSHLANIWAEKKFQLSKNLLANIGLKYNLYIADSYKQNKFDYDFGLKYLIKKGYFKIDFGQINQFVFQTGCSNIGFPTEFWIACNQIDFEPQNALGANFVFNRNLYRNKLNLEVSAFYKKLDNQVEYIGSFADMLFTYQLDDYIIFADGYNYGANFMLIKNVGNFTGQISYSWQRAKRTSYRFSEDYVYPANHDRPHELNALLSYKPNDKWNFASTLVLCTGNPCTIAEQLYMVNGTIVCEFKPYNSDRLPMYKRLDFSVTYNFREHVNYKHGINFSVYNLTRSRNFLYYTMKFYPEESTFAYRPFTFILKVLPSISYFIKF